MQKVTDLYKEESKEDAEFLEYFWLEIRNEYLTTLKYNRLWLPGIGEFRLKIKGLRTMLAKKLNLLKRYRTHYIPPERKQALEEEFRLLWKHYNDYKTKWYGENKKTV